MKKLIYIAFIFLVACTTKEEDIVNDFELKQDHYKTSINKAATITDVFGAWEPLREGNGVPALLKITALNSTTVIVKSVYGSMVDTCDLISPTKFIGRSSIHSTIGTLNGSILNIDAAIPVQSIAGTYFINVNYIK